MKTGVAPQPTALKKLRGNPGRRPLPKNEVKPDLVIPRAPAHLDASGRAKYYHLARRLSKYGLFSEADVENLSMLCDAWSIWRQAALDIQKNGITAPLVNGTTKANPSVLIARDARREIHRLSLEFGMTPAARTRIQVEEPEDETLADLLFGDKA
jgi:P27 family predicted phage terminase small subunit